MKIQVSFKTALSVSATVLGVFVASKLVDQARVAVTLVLVSGLLAVALHQGVDLLQRHRVSRWLAIAIVVACLVAVFVGFAFLVVPQAVKQARTFVEQAPGVVKQVGTSGLYRRLDAHFHLDAQVTRFEARWTDWAAPAFKTVRALLSGFAGAVEVFFLTVLMLCFGPQVIRPILAEVTVARRAHYELLLQQLYRSLGGYVRGLTLICSANAVGASTFLAIARVPFFLPLGLLCGLSGTVPYVGPLVMGVTTTLIVALTRGPWWGLGTAIYFTAYGQLEGSVLAPLVYRRTVEINPLVTFLSILLAGSALGIAGALLAIPAAAVGQILILDSLRLRRERLQVPARGDVAAAQVARAEENPPPEHPAH